MKYSALLIALAIATLPGTLAAQTTMQTQARDFAAHRVQDGRRLLLGPQPAGPLPVPVGQSCTELYAQRVALMQAQADYTPRFTDDPRNRAAVFIGTIFTPAFYYLAYSGVTEYLESGTRVDREAQLDALRQASAAQQCFVVR